MATPGAAQSATRLPQTNVLVFRNRQGEMVQATSFSQWQRRRAEILEGMQQVMGPLPSRSQRGALEVRVENEVDSGSYVRRFLTYAAEPGSRVPAYLLIPKAPLAGKTRAPAVLALHPTDMEYGHRVVVEQLRPAYRAYARDLAERGFVVLAPAYPLMANYQPDLKRLGYQSGTMKAIRDNMRGLDLLELLPFVERGRFGAIGHSLGGHNAIFTAVFEPRIKAVVSSCGFDSFVDYMNGNISGWTSERYMPRLLEYKQRLRDIPFDFHELLAVLAPRPVFISAPYGDANFNWRSVDEVVQAAAAVYRLAKAPGNLHLEHPSCAHDFPPEIRAEAYDFLEQALSPKKARHKQAREGTKTIP